MNQFNTFADSLLGKINNSMPDALKSQVLSLPKYAIFPFSKLPIKLQEKVLNNALNAVFKEQLQDDELDFLIDHWLRIEMTDSDYSCYFTVNPATEKQNSTIVVQKIITQTASVVFSAQSHALVLLANKAEDPDTLFFQRKLLVTGDTELGLEIKNLLDDMDISHLPKLTKILLDRYCEITRS